MFANVQLHRNPATQTVTFWDYTRQGGVVSTYEDFIASQVKVDPTLPASLGTILGLSEWLPRYMASRPPRHLTTLLRQMREQFPELRGEEIRQVAFELGNFGGPEGLSARDAEDLIAAVESVYGLTLRRDYVARAIEGGQKRRGPGKILR